MAFVMIVSLLAAGIAFGATTAASPEVPTAEIVMRNSRFEPGRMTVEAGTALRFAVRNLDPIDHELIIGPAAVQRVHETGTETTHGARPGEVSVPAGETRTTTYRFDTPGTITFGCHLPGHYAYGMKATVTVR